MPPQRPARKPICQSFGGRNRIFYDGPTLAGTPRPDVLANRKRIMGLGRGAGQRRDRAGIQLQSGVRVEIPPTNFYGRARAFAVGPAD